AAAGGRAVRPHRPAPGADRLRRARHPAHRADPRPPADGADRRRGVLAGTAGAGSGQRLHRDQCGGEGRAVPGGGPRPGRGPALRADRGDLRRQRRIHRPVVQAARHRARLLLVRHRLHCMLAAGVPVDARYPAAFAHRPGSRLTAHPTGAPMSAAPPDRPHLVVIGGGFAGLWATRALARAPLRITLVDRSNHHLFQPLLYQVATAGLSAPDIAAPLRHILRRQRNVEIRLAEANAIDPQARCVALADGTRLQYDYLLLATGATHAYFGNEQWARHASGLKSLDDALE